MCGITGIFDFGQRNNRDLANLVQSMNFTVVHRGPDDAGVFVDEKSGLALGHRRLSIVDLNESGAQPMHSQDGAMVLVYNGEVYNYEELRSELLALGASFRGSSDTEVVLEGFRIWGVEATVRRLIGMFAFALWNREEQRLVLGRDRLGIKPLYYSTDGDCLLFGSELKSLRAHPRFNPEIDRGALKGFFRHGYVHSPSSIYASAKKLMPGTLLEIGPDHKPSVITYWSFKEHVLAGQAQRFAGSDGEAKERLKSLINDAVSRRMVADVPLGAFLSGGIDSSLVTSVMQANSGTPIKTFSIGFDAEGYNEAHYAKEIAQYLGTDHKELYVSQADARDVIPLLPTLYDEPFADLSQIPTYLVSKLAREDVTVVLTGDGGDELFAGYNRYMSTRRLARLLLRYPKTLRKLAAGAIDLTPVGLFTFLGEIAPGPLRTPTLSAKAAKTAKVLRMNEDQVYRYLFSHWDQPDQIVVGGDEAVSDAWREGAPEVISDPVERMTYIDHLSYLPDDILTKVDRASMSVSLEARVPLIDHRIVEFACSLPAHLKMRANDTKWILKQVLYDHVPRALIDRPKMGFGVPMADWLRGPLKEWAYDLLHSRAITEGSLLNPAPLHEAMEDLQAGTQDTSAMLWDVLQFESWRREWLPK